MAPFISLLERINFLLDKHERVGPVIMLFGIMNDHANFIFKDFLLGVFGKLKSKSEIS